MKDGAECYSRYIEGDDEGLVDIIQEYKDGLMLYINNIVRDIHTAEDLTEDTFVKLAVKKPKYKKKFSFKAWLYTIGRNTAIDYCRKHRREMSAENIEDHMDTSDAEDIEKNFIQNEDRLTLYRMTAKLCTDHQQVLYLKYIEQLSNEDTAAAMGKSKRQIEQLLYTAKKNLRKELEKGGFQYEKL